MCLFYTCIQKKCFSSDGQRPQPISSRNYEENPDHDCQTKQLAVQQGFEEEDEAEEEENDGYLLDKVRSKPPAKETKNSVKFLFTVCTDIFELGLDEENIRCGIVITDDGTEGSSSFFAASKLGVDYEQKRLSMHVRVNFKDFTRKSFSYCYAVSDSPETSLHSHKNIAFSSTTSVSNTDSKEFDDRAVVQKFHLQNYTGCEDCSSQGDVPFSPATEEAEIERVNDMATATLGDGETKSSERVEVGFEVSTNRTAELQTGSFSFVFECHSTNAANNYRPIVPLVPQITSWQLFLSTPSTIKCTDQF